MTPEFSHPVPLSEIGGKEVHYKLAADQTQRTALVKRLVVLEPLGLQAQPWQSALPCWNSAG
jgi:hypothetical protein